MVTGYHAIEHLPVNFYLSFFDQPLANSVFEQHTAFARLFGFQLIANALALSGHLRRIGWRFGNNLRNHPAFADRYRTEDATRQGRESRRNHTRRAESFDRAIPIEIARSFDLQTH